MQAPSSKEPEEWVECRPAAKFDLNFEVVSSKCWRITLGPITQCERIEMSKRHKLLVAMIRFSTWDCLVANRPPDNSDRGPFGGTIETARFEGERPTAGTIIPARFAPQARSRGTIIPGYPSAGFTTWDHHLSWQMADIKRPTGRNQSVERPNGDIRNLAQRDGALIVPVASVCPAKVSSRCDDCQSG